MISDGAVLTVLPDTDQDGLPDAWESAQGFKFNDPSDARADADGDGMSNLAEYIAGTNPLNPNDYLKLGIRAGGTNGLQFEAVANRTYTIQCSGSLTGSWFNLVDVFATPTNRVETISEDFSAATRFYRIVTPKRP
jgi:hypothetical protein